MQNNLHNSISSTHIDNSLSVYLFLEFVPWLGKSEEFDNLVMKSNRALLEAILFYHK